MPAQAVESTMDFHTYVIGSVFRADWSGVPADTRRVGEGAVHSKVLLLAVQRCGSYHRFTPS